METDDPTLPDRGSVIYPVYQLQQIPFALTSLVEVCTNPGTYQRELARRTARQIENELNTIIRALQARGIKSDEKVQI